MNLDQLLDMLDSEAQNSAYENLSSFESDAAYEVENYLKKQGFDQRKASKMANVAVKRPAFAQPLINAARANNGQGMALLTGNENTRAKMAAQFDIKITRVTANIVENLPFVLFAPQDAENGYRSIINNLPAGVVLTRVRFGENSGFANSLVFTYTSAAGSDDVAVTCNQYPYPSFLQSIAVDMFKLSKMRYGISIAASQTQYDNDFKFVTRSMFGKSSSNSLSVGSFKSPNQFLQDKIDIDGVFDLDKETGILNSIIPTAGFSVTMSMFVEKFYLQNSKGF